MKAEDHTFVLSGAGSGLGQELTLKLLARGARVAGCDIHPEALAETTRRAGDHGGRLSTHVTDVSDRDAVEQLVGAVLDRHGHVDGLINNAGIIQPFQRLLDLDDADIDHVMHVNFHGTLYMTRAFLPHLLTRPEAHIVNVSSMGGFLPVPGQAIYCASKAAVKLLTEALYAELLDTNVRVTGVFPGAMATNIAANSGVELAASPEAEASALPADEAAERVIKGMERDAFQVLVGSDAYIMDKLARLMPEGAVKLIQKRMQDLLE